MQNQGDFLRSGIWPIVELNVITAIVKNGV